MSFQTTEFRSANNNNIIVATAILGPATKFNNYSDQYFWLYSTLNYMKYNNIHMYMYMDSPLEQEVRILQSNLYWDQPSLVGADPRAGDDGDGDVVVVESLSPLLARV